MIDPDDPLEVQVAKQARIIDALVQRANRQHELGTSAYGAFQQAIALQGQVWAKTRDLERASTELEQVRLERERSRRNLADALAAMEGGFALFTDGRLELWNDLFQTLLPDLADCILPGLEIERYFKALRSSAHLRTADPVTIEVVREARRAMVGTAALSFTCELAGDRWYQFGLQRTSETGIVILQTEITGIVRRNRSEKENLIDRQAHYLQAAFDNMGSGICTFSGDGAVLMHNDRFRDLLGLPFTLLQKGRALSEIMGFIQTNGLILDSQALDFELWEDRLNRQGRVRKRMRHASGRMLDLHAHRLPDRGFILDVRDVTLESSLTEMLEKRVEERTEELTHTNRRLTAQYQAQARVEEELRLAKEKAEAVVRSKTRFLAAASHDLLQPINAAKLLISTLSELAQGGALAPTVERLEGSFTSIEQLLHALLDISRLDSTQSAVSPSDVSLGPLMRGIIADQAPLAARKGVQLDIVPCSVFVRSDPRFLLRSIQNLVVNAIQYTDRGGRVLVGCRRRGDEVVLQVWDTGMGISKEDQTRIFEEFTRADNVPPGSGMGLGLSIVDRTCRHLGHKVAVRSKPGVGSVFSITMAVVPGIARPCPDRRPVAAETGPADMDLIVLLVENDADVLFATTQKLESWGASVLAVSSTAAALQAVRDIGMPPDILLADYQLDGSDTGLEAIRALRQETGTSLPAIMITADHSAELVRTGARMGFTVLTKPVELSRLRPLIDWKTRARRRAPAESLQ